MFDKLSSLEVAAEAAMLFAEMQNQFPEKMEGRFGGFLTIQRVGADEPIHVEKICLDHDLINDERFIGWEKNSREKASRLSRMTADHHHVSSWQSRDFDNKKYGGAIVAGEWVLSFSGLPEFGDERLMIKLARSYEEISDSEVDEICRISGNDWILEAA